MSIIYLQKYAKSSNINLYVILYVIILDHHPKTMRVGCLQFIANWDDELHELLVGRPDDEFPVLELCYQKSNICSGLETPRNLKLPPGWRMENFYPVKIV